VRRSTVITFIDTKFVKSCEKGGKKKIFYSVSSKIGWEKEIVT
jgi:hypothetical protein